MLKLQGMIGNFSLKSVHSPFMSVFVRLYQRNFKCMYEAEPDLNGNIAWKKFSLPCFQNSHSSLFDFAVYRYCVQKIKLGKNSADTGAIFVNR